QQADRSRLRHPRDTTQPGSQGAAQQAELHCPLARTGPDGAEGPWRLHQAQVTPPRHPHRTRKPMSEITDGLERLRTLTPVETLMPLYELASMVPEDEAIVELGTYRGASACWLGAGARDGLGAHVWTVDPHDLPGYRTTTGRGSGGLDFTDPAIRK